MFLTFFGLSSTVYSAAGAKDSGRERRGVLLRAAAGGERAGLLGDGAAGAGTRRRGGGRSSCALRRGASHRWREVLALYAAAGD